MKLTMEKTELGVWIPRWDMRHLYCLHCGQNAIVWEEFELDTVASAKASGICPRDRKRCHGCGEKSPDTTTSGVLGRMIQERLAVEPL